MFYVYMVKNSAGKLYVGISQNPDERVAYHNNRQGSKFTKYIPNHEIVFLEKYINMTEARQREIQIKKWRREKKEVLIVRYQKGLSTKL